MQTFVKAFVIALGVTLGFIAAVTIFTLVVVYLGEGK